MRFNLDHTPQKPGYTIGHNDGAFFTGSCFSSNIGGLFEDLRFKAMQNPYGILFNPLSIYNSLHSTIHNKTLDNRFVLNRDNTYYSYWHHSSVQAQSSNELAGLIEEQQKKAQQFVASCKCLFITFGTAYYYHHTTLDIVVANCHKQPGSIFEKKLADVEEIVDVYSGLINDLLRFNPGIKIIFTVSPVKHLKDGLVENNLSKSTLLLTVHKLCRSHPACFYFPAYELVNDDLRDYRFYKEDLAHPNEQAIAYVWEKFSACFFDSATQALNEKLSKFNKALAHRPGGKMDSEHASHQKYITGLKEEINKMAPGLVI